MAAEIEVTLERSRRFYEDPSLQSFWQDSGRISKALSIVHCTAVSWIAQRKLGETPLYKRVEACNAYLAGVGDAKVECSELSHRFHLPASWSIRLCAAANKEGYSGALIEAAHKVQADLDARILDAVARDPAFLRGSMSDVATAMGVCWEAASASYKRLGLVRRCICPSCGLEFEFKRLGRPGACDNCRATWRQDRVKQRKKTCREREAKNIDKCMRAAAPETAIVRAPVADTAALVPAGHGVGEALDSYLSALVNLRNACDRDIERIRERGTSFLKMQSSAGVQNVEPVPV